jgi:glycosyltransferase involved in cell wall biosynthesis
MPTRAGELVTVYVPCYDVAPYLPQVIESVLGQTHRNLELLLIVDGDCHDDTPLIARRHAELDERVRVIDVPHCPLTHKYQLGADEARGAWLSPLDGDDAFRPTKLERQLAAAAGSPDVVAWACWYAHMGEGGQHIRDSHHGPTTAPSSTRCAVRTRCRCWSMAR